MPRCNRPIWNRLSRASDARPASEQRAVELGFHRRHRRMPLDNARTESKSAPALSGTHRLRRNARAHRSDDVTFSVSTRGSQALRSAEYRQTELADVRTGAED